VQSSSSSSFSHSQAEDIEFTSQMQMNFPRGKKRIPGKTGAEGARRRVDFRLLSLPLSLVPEAAQKAVRFTPCSSRLCLKAHFSIIHLC